MFVRINRYPMSAMLLTLGFTLANTALSNQPVQAAPAKGQQRLSALKPRPGYVIGRVMNSAGKPLPGATVGIYGTTIAGENTRFEAETNAAGQVSQRVPEGIYGVSAYYKAKFNGKNYNFTLHPKDGTTAKKHDSAKGVIKEFAWRIAGLKPGQEASDADTGMEASKYHGGYVYLKSKEEGFGGDKVYFPTGSTLVITMTPRGKLIDGSTGQTKTFKRTFNKDVTSGIATHLMDIPIGLYTLKAQLQLPSGTSKELGVKKSVSFSEPFMPSVNVDFEPTSFGDMQMMQVTVEP